MSEDNKKKTTDKTIQITPDAQNARSANAIPNRDILSAEPDLNGIVPEDDILEIIRQRKAAEASHQKAERNRPLSLRMQMHRRLRMFQTLMSFYLKDWITN